MLRGPHLFSSIGSADGKTGQRAHSRHTGGQHAIVESHESGNQPVKPFTDSLRGMQCRLPFLRQMRSRPADGIGQMKKVTGPYAVRTLRHGSAFEHIETVSSAMPVALVIIGPQFLTCGNGDNQMYQIGKTIDQTL